MSSSRKRRSTSSSSSSSAIKPIPAENNEGGNNNLPFYSSQKPLAIDSNKKYKRAGTIEVPKYFDSKNTTTTTTGNSESIADVKEDDMNRYVRDTMRVVLAAQCCRRVVTGTDIKKHIFPNGGSDISATRGRLLFTRIRQLSAERFKRVFGFELIAGDPEDQFSMKEPWQLVNGLKSDDLNKTLNANDDNKVNVARAALMICLSLILLHNGTMREIELVKELEFYGFSKDGKTKTTSEVTGQNIIIEDAKTISAYLGEWTKEKLLVKGTTEIKNTDAKAETTYTFGPTTLNTIGKRAIVQFLLASSGIKMVEAEELQLLGIIEDDE
jgi:hypothetical protein